MESSLDTSAHQRFGTVARLGAAAALFVGGLVHLQLYLDGYRDFPNENLGRSFLAQVVASVVLSVVLVFRSEAVARFAAAGVLAGTLAAFALSRSDRGVFGFSERGFNPSPQAALAVGAAVVGLVLLAVTFAPAVGPGVGVRMPAAAVLGVAAIVLAVGSGALWAQEDEPTAGPQVTTASTATTTVTVPTSASPAPSTTGAPPTTVSAPGVTTEASIAPSAPPPTTAVPPATTAVPPATTVPSAPASGAVSIVDFTFQPTPLEVPVGATVDWVNNDSFAHSVVAEDQSFVSESLGSGDEFEFTFDTAGTFSYICGIHPSMQSEVVVTG